MRLVRVLGLFFPIVVGSAQADDQPSPASPFGLERRIPWNDSHVVGSPDPPTPYRVARAFPNVNVQQPLALYPEPGSGRLFILQHLNHWAGPGRILTIPDDQAATDPKQLLEINGLAVGLAFHPQYEQNGYLFVGLSGPSTGRKKTTQVVRYTVDRKPPYGIDPASKLLIIEWESGGHDGGDLDFGNDGLLFVSAGDGTSGSDPILTGQRIDDLLGSVLRIDVDHPDPGRNYGIPKDNPFVDRPGARPELWAYGLRNPWRLSFDRPSGQLWVGNNGQDLWEQVYLIEKGGNYGWSVTEGSAIFAALRQQGPDPILPPAAQHHHSEARSLTGGRVYRGTRLPELVGTYLYGDWSTGRVWGIKHDGTQFVEHRLLVDTPFNITGFGTDHANELYVIDQVTGFFRLEPTTEADIPAKPFPTRLTETGLFASVPDHIPHPAALPFDVAAPQWADGATMERFAAMPGLDRIVQKPQKNAGGAWTLPNGSVLVQTLSLDLATDSKEPKRTRIETRLLVRHQDEWTGYSYRWNDEQTDATLVPGAGEVAEFEVTDPARPDGRRDQSWRFPSRTECLVCHSRASGFTLGFSPLQLDREHDYGGTIDNQLRTFEHIGLFEGELPKRKPGSPKLVDPYDSRVPLETRVRSYLHVNCSTCHVSEGGGNANMELGLSTPTRRMHLINELPMHSNLEIPGARLVAPGSLERSILYQRISRRETGQMPPLASTEVDPKGLELFSEWIRGLATSDQSTD